MTTNSSQGARLQGTEPSRQDAQSNEGLFKSVVKRFGEWSQW